MEKLLAEVLEKVNLVGGELNKLQEGQQRIDTRFDKVDTGLDKVDARLGKMDARFDNMDVRLDKVDTKLDQIEDRLEKLEDDQKEVKEKVAVVYDQVALLTETADELSRDMYKLTDAIDYFRHEASENKEELFRLKKRIRAM